MFKIDEVVLWYSPVHPEYHGIEVTIISNLQIRIDLQNNAFYGYDIDTGINYPNKYPWAAEPQHLHKLPPQNDLTSWDALKDIYKPRILETVT